MFVIDVKAIISEVNIVLHMIVPVIIVAWVIIAQEFMHKAVMFAVTIDAVWFAIEKFVFSWLAMFAATELTVWLSILS